MYFGPKNYISVGNYENNHIFKTWLQIACHMELGQSFFFIKHSQNATCGTNAKNTVTWGWFRNVCDCDYERMRCEAKGYVGSSDAVGLTNWDAESEMWFFLNGSVVKKRREGKDRNTSKSMSLSLLSNWENTRIYSIVCALFILIPFLHHSCKKTWPSERKLPEATY